MHAAPCTPLQPRVLGPGLRQKLQSILMSKIIQQECMCIFDIVSSFQAQPSGYDPCPLQGRGKSPNSASSVHSCQLFHSPYGPRDRPCFEWARSSPAISTWAGDFKAMDKAVRPAYKRERKGKTNFYPICFPPQKERVSWEPEIYTGHGSLFQAFSEERRRLQWHEDHRNELPSVETAFTPGKSVPMKIKNCHLVFNTFSFKIGKQRDENNSSIISLHRPKWEVAFWWISLQSFLLCKCVVGFYVEEWSCVSILNVAFIFNSP